MIDFFRLTLCIFGLFLVQELSSQENLVPNGGFEELEKRVKRFSQVDPETNTNSHLTCKPLNWFDPIGSTPDFLVQGCYIPKGTQRYGLFTEPLQGRSMVGLMTYDVNTIGGRHEHEFLSVALKSPLVPGKKYSFQMLVKANPVIGNRTNNTGMLLTTYKPTRPMLDIHKNMHRPQYQSAEVPADTIIYTLQGSFVADSAFRYLTIGNFMKDEDTRVETQPALVKRCQFQGYVFLDSVCIMTSGPDLILKDVSFKTNSSELSAKAKSILTAFANEVKGASPKQLRIEGHTDDQSDDAYNQRLSEARATAVAVFLEKLLPGTQMIKIGLGESQPAVPNTSPENRSLNRRVELFLE